MSRKRRVLYGRTSVSNGRSVDDQLTELREWAEDDDREIVGEFRDDGISASRFANGKARDDWDAVKAMITSRATDEVGVWEGSRTTRKIVESAELLDLCSTHGVYLAVRDRVYDPADGDDRARLLHDAVDAEHESNKISKRVKKRVRQRAASGAPHGLANWGYRVVRDPETGATVGRIPDPATAPVVREVIHRLLAGETAASLAKELNRREVTTPRGSEWTGSNLITTVRRPAYAGIRTSTRHDLPEGHPGDWEPLISREDHDRLVVMLGDPGRKTVRSGDHTRHLLSGVAACGVCGARIRVTSRRATASGARPRDYTCSAGSHVSRVAEKVDAYVEAIVLRFLGHSDVAEQLSDPRDVERAEARAEVARQERKLLELEAQMDADELDVAAGSRLMKSARERLERAQDAARPRHIPGAVTDVAGPEAADRWERTPVAIRRQIVRALFVVTIDPAGRGGRPEFRPETVRVERRTV